MRKSIITLAASAFALVCNSVHAQGTALGTPLQAEQEERSVTPSTAAAAEPQMPAQAGAAQPAPPAAGAPQSRALIPAPDNSQALGSAPVPLMGGTGTRPPPGQMYDDGSGEPVFYEPTPSERLVVPGPLAPPPPPPPRHPRLVGSAYMQVHTFVGGDVSGSLTELGAKIGWAPGVLKIAYVPDGKLAVIGAEFIHFFGIRLTDPAPDMRVALLLPAPAFQVVTDLSRNMFVTPQLSGPGVGLTACGDLPFFLQVRAFGVSAWVPVEVAMADAEKAQAGPLVSLSFITLEAGLLLY